MKRSAINPRRFPGGATTRPLRLCRAIGKTRRKATRAVALAALFIFPAFAHAQADRAAAPIRRALLDDDLRTRDVTILSIDDRQIAYADHLGRARQSPLADVVALLPLDGDAPQPQRASMRRRGVLTLIDGRRYPGEHTPGVDAPDAVAWRHPALGAVAHALDDVDSIAFVPEGRDFVRTRDPGALRDAVLLANGDALDGFIIAVGANIEIDVDGQIVSVPAERVHALTMSNPHRAPSGALAWLDDGAVVRLTSVAPDGGESLSVTIDGGQSSRIALGAVRAFVPDAARLRPLASLTPTEQTAVGERRTFEPARSAPPANDAPAALGAHDIELPGPMRIAYELPPGAARFGAVAELPRDAWPWGDCVLIVTIDGREALRERLNMDRPRVEFSVPANGRAITITLDEGAYGPINDRVILRRPLLLVGQPAS